MIPVLALVVLRLASRFFHRAFGRRINREKFRLIAGGAIIGSFLGVRYGRYRYEPDTVRVISPVDEDRTSRYVLNIPEEFVLSPAGRPVSVIDPEPSTGWIAEKLFRTPAGLMLIPARIHDPLTRTVDRKAIERVSHRAEELLEDALAGYVRKRTGAKAEARRIIAKLRSLERRLEREFRDAAKGEEKK